MTLNDQTGEVGFTKNEKDPLSADAVIVDEMSMDAEMTLSYLMKMMLLKEQTELGKDPEEI